MTIEGNGKEKGPYGRGGRLETYVWDGQDRESWWDKIVHKLTRLAFTLGNNVNRGFDSHLLRGQKLVNEVGTSKCVGCGAIL